MPIYIHEPDENLESLNEVKITSSGELSIYVEGEGREGHGWSNDPYFKVFHGPDKMKSTYVSRIYFSRAEYVKDHRGTHGIPKILNSKQVKKLVKMITPEIWERMNDKIAEVLMGNTKTPPRYDMPDYMELIGKDM